MEISPIAMEIDPKSGFCRQNGVYYSKDGQAELPPPWQPLDVATYVLSRIPDAARSQTAFVDAASGEILDYAALKRNVSAIAAALRRMGARKGHVLMIASPNSVTVPCVCLAVLSLGAVLTTANPLNTPREILAQIADSRACLLLTVSELGHKLRASGIRIPMIAMDHGSSESSGEFVSTVAQMLETPPAASKSGEIVFALRQTPVEGAETAVRQEDTATLLYSSGTTGKMKGVVSTHRNVISGVAAALHRRRALVEKQQKPETSLVTVPLFHVFGFVTSLVFVAEQCACVLLPKFDLAAMLAAVEKYRLNSLPAWPLMIVALIKSPLARRYDLSSLKFVISGGTALGKDVAAKFSATFPGVQILQGYGLTEVSGPVSGCIGTEGKENTKLSNPGSGPLLPNVEAKIVDVESGKSLLPNHKGELWIRGPSIMKGYLRNIEATEAVKDTEGWLKTGDLCYFDKDGNLHIVDRIKELIKYIAHQVPPAELEELLLSHPEIVDAAVIPYPDETAGQIPMAFIVRKCGSALRENDVMDFIANQVAPYKKVRKVAFVKSIPKSSAGKILRKDLIQQALTYSKL